MSVRDCTVVFGDAQYARIDKELAFEVFFCDPKPGLNLAIAYAVEDRWMSTFLKRCAAGGIPLIGYGFYGSVDGETPYSFACDGRRWKFGPYGAIRPAETFLNGSKKDRRAVRRIAWRALATMDPLQLEDGQ